MNKKNKKIYEKYFEADDLVLMSKEPSKSEVLYEDTAKRGKRTKHFRLKNGNYMAVLYDRPVHRLDAPSGKYVDMASDLRENENDYEAVLEKYKVRLPKTEGKQNFVSVNKGGREIAWRYIPKQTARRKRSVAKLCSLKNETPWEPFARQSVKYQKADSMADLEYSISEDGVKENIILSKCPKSEIFTFELKLSGLTPILSEDKKTVFLIADDLPIDSAAPELVIPPANMTDGRDAYSEDIHYEIRSTDKGIFLDMVIESDWLSSPKRVYPVVIDPRVEIYGSDASNMTMKELCSDSTAIAGTSTAVQIGVDREGHVHRMCIDIDLPELATGYQITKAGLIMHQGYANYYDSPDTYLIREANVTDAYYDTFTFNWDNVQPSETIDSFYGYQRSAAEEIEFDITATVRNWYANGNGSFHGLLVQKEDETLRYCDGTIIPTYIHFYTRYASSNYRPKLYVEYACEDMYADHQKYHTFDVGRAGTGSINLWTGKFSFAHTDISLKSARMPLTVSHLYRPEFNDTKYGKGWKLSVEQTLEIIDQPTIVAVYTDAGGKRHYFTQDSNGKITDEAGLGLTFEYACQNVCGYVSSYRIVDEQGNKMLFDSNGKLIQLLDANENGSHLFYTNGNLTRVIDGNSNVASFEYQNGKLSRIVDADGDALTFTYEGDFLTSIVYPSPSGDPRTTVFAYTNNKLTQIKDASGIAYTVTYIPGDYVIGICRSGNLKVENGSVTEVDAISDDGISFEYRGRSTAVKNERTKIKNVYNFDSSGRVITSYCDLSEVGQEDFTWETTLTDIFDYASIMNSDETSKMGKYRSLSLSLHSDVSEQTNLLENGMFGNGSYGWDVHGYVAGTCGVSDENYIHGRKSYYFGESNTEAYKYLSQTVTVCGRHPEGNVLVASAWAKSPSHLTSDSTARFRLVLTLTYENGEVKEYAQNYDVGYYGWQYAVIPVIMDEGNIPYKATVKLDFSSNIGTCYFTNARLVTVDGNVTTNTYQKGNEYITSIGVFGECKNIKQISTHSNGILTTASYQDTSYNIVYSVITDRDGNRFENYFKYDDKHNLLKKQDYRGVVTETTYNEYGKMLTQKAYHKDTPDKYMYSEYTYDNAQNLKTERDPRYLYDGNVLVKRYTYDTVRGLLQEKIDLNGEIYTYTYDSKTDEMKRLSSASENMILQNDFSYTRWYLTQVAHNGFNYGFAFDALGRDASVSIGGTPLFTKEYEKTDLHETVRTVYTGGEETEMIYDFFGNPVMRIYKGKNTTAERALAWAEYNGAQNLKVYVDCETDIWYYYTYNAHGEVTNIQEKRDNQTLCTNTFSYDDKRRLSATSYGAVGQVYRPIYEKNASGCAYPDNVVVGVKLDNKFTDQTSKDSLGRTAVRTLTVGNAPLFTENYSYLQTPLSGGRTIETAIVSGISGQFGGTSANIAYTYDVNGNIESVTSNTAVVAKYRYDTWNRLVREDNYAFGKTYTWTYDVGGNITEKRTYTLCTGDTLSGSYTTDTYGYASSGWKDRLTSYNGETFTYDALGNPTTYRGRTLEWTKVRRLAKFEDVEFTYNADGIRTSKKANGVTRTYTLTGSSLLKETDGTKTLTYYHGGSGIIGFNYNGTDYYFRKNLQGDVIEIYTSAGVCVAKYTYDAWGNHKILDASGNEVASAAHIGYINPIRYRGYYFDVEIGLYYLQQRYYDPQIGRWLNADKVISAVGGDIRGYNLFAYCFNNTVNMDDKSGDWPQWFKDAVKYVSKNIVRPIVKSVQSALSKVDATYSGGLSISATPSAFIFSAQGGVSVDTDGNIAIQGSFSGGLTTGTPGASITAYQTTTNAPDIEKLNGRGYQIGGSIGGIPVYNVPILAVGGDVNMIPDTDQDKIYYGNTISVGMGTPGAEVHCEWGETVTWKETQFNIFNIAEFIYIRIMAW